MHTLLSSKFLQVSILTILLISCNNDTTNTANTGNDTTVAAKDTVVAVTSPAPDAAPAAIGALVSTLEGLWQLSFISGPRIAFEGLYPGKIPQLNFNLAEGKVSGNTGCNSLNGPVRIDSSSIQFGNFITTKMACQGQGEMVFLNTIKKINRFSITGDTTLHLIMGDVAMMNFKRVK